MKLVISADKASIQGFLSFLAVLVYSLEFGETPNIAAKQMRDWATNTIDYLSEYNISSARNVTRALSIYKPDERLTEKEWNAVAASGKAIRDSIWSKRTKVMSDPNFNADMRLFLAPTLTYLSRHTEAFDKE